MKFLKRVRDYFNTLTDPALKRKRAEQRKAKEMGKRLQKNQSSKDS